MSKIKKLIELAERAEPNLQVDCADMTYNQVAYIAAACPANLIPILKCAERMAEYLKSGTRHYSLLLELLKEWDELNK